MINNDFLYRLLTHLYDLIAIRQILTNIIKKIILELFLKKIDTVSYKTTLKLPLFFSIFILQKSIKTAFNKSV